MVAGAFPAAKLGLLAIRQVSKPIANIIKDKAKENVFFRNYICMPPAQFYNWIEIKTKMWALNLGKPVSVPPLNEAMAIELGANLLGEFIIFAIGATVLIIEYARQSKNEYKKKEAEKESKIELTNTLTEMAFRLERQDTQIREMSRVLADLDSRSIFRWHRERLPEYTIFDPHQPDQTPKVSLDNIYEPNSGLIFKALHFLERNIFTNVPKRCDENKHHSKTKNAVMMDKRKEVLITQDSPETQ